MSKRMTKTVRPRVRCTPPSDAEGLGFIELIASQDLEAHDIDLDYGPADVACRVDISPLLATAVFVTLTARLAAELGNPVTGARAMRRCCSTSARRYGAGERRGRRRPAKRKLPPPGDLDDSETVREEATFHAACCAASMGWSVATAA